MAQTTIYDLLETTLINMPRPATTHDIYMRLIENGAYKHMEPSQATKIISNKLCKMRDKGLLVGLVSDNNRRMFWDFAKTIKPERKPDAIEQPIMINTKSFDNTHVLRVLFLDISAALTKAANGLISHDK